MYHSFIQSVSQTESNDRFLSFDRLVSFEANSYLDSKVFLSFLFDGFRAFTMDVLISGVGWLVGDIGLTGF